MMRKRLTDAERRLAEEADRLTARRETRFVSAVWRYGQAILWVLLAFAYCMQWGDADHMPRGGGTVFLVAVAFSIVIGGHRSGWLAAILAVSLSALFFYPHTGAFLITVGDRERFVWFVVSMLTPLLVERTRGTPHSPRLIRRIRSSIRSITSSMASMGLPSISRSTNTP